jgi:Winged helix-turn helix
VNEGQQYSGAEIERMMKIQEVLLRAMAKKITWWQAAEIIGVTERTMRRWRERIEEQGYSGLSDGRKGKPSPRRVPLATAEKVAAVVTGGVLRPEHTTFSRKAERVTCHRAELCMGTESAARRWLGGETAQAWGAPAEKTAAAVGWYVAAY